MNRLSGSVAAVGIALAVASAADAQSWSGVGRYGYGPGYGGSVYGPYRSSGVASALTAPLPGMPGNPPVAMPPPAAGALDPTQNIPFRPNANVNTLEPRPVPTGPSAYPAADYGSAAYSGYTYPRYTYPAYGSYGRGRAGPFGRVFRRFRR